MHGLSLEDYSDDMNATLWQESWSAFEVYAAVGNQWRFSAGGPVGLDYSVVYAELAHRGITGEARDELMYKLGVLESAALNRMYK